MLIKITRDELIIYENDEDHCEDAYTEESDEIVESQKPQFYLPMDQRWSTAS